MTPWECPRCHVINGPLAQQCTCKPKPAESPEVKEMLDKLERRRQSYWQEPYPPLDSSIWRRS